MEKILNLNELEQKRIEYNSISKSIKFDEYDKIQIDIISTVPENQWIYLVYDRPLTELDLSKKSYTSNVEFKELHLKRPEVLENRGYRPYNTDHGVVMCGWRHPNVIYQMVAITGLKMHEAGDSMSNSNEHI